MKHLFILMCLFSCNQGVNTSSRVIPNVKIGDTYQNGIVFYILQPGDPSYLEGEVHGFVSALDDSVTIFGCFDSEASNYTNYLGDGLYNTRYTLNSCPNTKSIGSLAASVKDGYEWFVPNEAEFRKLVNNKNLVGNFIISDYYWVSIKLTNFEAGIIRISDYSTQLLQVNYQMRVRLIHKF